MAEDARLMLDGATYSVLTQGNDIYFVCTEWGGGGGDCILYAAQYNSAVKVR